VAWWRSTFPDAKEDMGMKWRRERKDGFEGNSQHACAGFMILTRLLGQYRAILEDAIMEGEH
jgi:hypothetical protein